MQKERVSRIEFPLQGPAGEPVDLWRTMISHGLSSLPPMSVDEGSRSLRVTVPLSASRPRTVRISESDGLGVVTILGRPVSERAARAIGSAVRTMLALDEDLSDLYAAVLADPDLAWVAGGAGRMVRSPTLFEDVVKTICTTNCAWSATVRMVTALVENLGAPAPGAPPTGPEGRAFPTAEAMAAAPPEFYRDTMRAGYRTRYLLELSTAVSEGRLDLEALRRMDRSELPDAELAAMLLALPGVGPYAAAHIMMTMGRRSLLVLDSWTRPKYARLTGKRKVSDAAIRRRFTRYGENAGLAFWLFVTKDWALIPESTGRDDVV